MTTRRQASTTSLSKFARAGSPELNNKNLDFCNAFWGLGDGGVDVLFARMRGASRTMDELRNFWRERASIEEDYAKRLSKLAKVNVGKDEIGELRNSLDTLRLETDKQASYHMNLAKQVKDDLEAQTAAFCAKQAHHKKTFQAAIEKEFKNKQTQESYVNKAREKYESDCLRINSYTAQSTLVQGKDLEKINLKLERAQQTVQANERDFANFARALADTVRQWEIDWKAFCDSCQDMEEERMEFVKDNMWAYANAISTVCVNDDESCEHMRLSLEQFEPERDMENFVRDYGTGNAIPDPPQFVNYTAQDAVPSSATRPTTHPAVFARSTQRTRSMMSSLPPNQPDDPPAVNTAGVGAGGGKAPSDTALTRSDTTRTQPYANGTGAGAGASPAPYSDLSRKPTMSSQAHQSGSPYRSSPADPDAEPIGHNSETMIKIGSNAYKVDLNKDPQAQGPNMGRPGSTPLQNGKPGVGDETDPLARQRDMLLNSAGSTRRTHQSGQSKDLQRRPTRKGTADSALSPPGASSGAPSPGPNRDYRNSAEVVVGAYPLPTSPSRSTSPNANPPSAAFMQPPRQATSPIPVESVVSNYEQSLPGERKSVNRSDSRQANYLGHSPQPSQNSNVERGRPVSRDGHAGVGANGRSRSPQPMQPLPISRSASPILAQQAVSGLSHRNSYIQPPAASGYQGGGGGPQRATSPNIALDASGKVVMDGMADRYAQQQRPQQQQPPPQPQWNQPPPPPPIQNPATVQRRTSYQPPPQNQPPYGGPPPTAAPVGYGPPPGQQQPLQRQPTYGQPQQPPYGPPPPAPYQQPAPPPQQAVYTQPQMTGYAPQQPALQRGMSVGGGYYNQQGYGHQQQPSQHSTYSYRAPSPAAQVQRSPSPQPPPQPSAQQGPPPTGQYTEDGKPVLFYVKALYDYQATIEEEFDFQAGDIIAVTATPEDGWWSGELLDEQRRQPGRTVFPSNFVCLF
ncbi:hypothetical protein PUNSTDRAFT_105403 [Punctularia strigosozonata HHB-11173 SS5]|uniref:uncharacterized protein n=1 Tax=Punctularia strigosozonata (strain HHB-11173) TaxID=741275 RepID=UPI0004416E1C|nr:uncharacterized protein PUNSTDRAFT_105403 [Punctularia strigosozonata HHB-11173 SS5]EIN06419.1 hypothetical protein PUNSTDRAFT_105403 [Punctularia strigosozonata HHB-11173 SS5]